MHKLFKIQTFKHLLKLLRQFKVCNSVHHYRFQINQPTSFSSSIGATTLGGFWPANQPTRCINLSSLLLDVYLQLNMFRGVLTPIIRSSTTAVAVSDFTFGAW